MPRAGQLIGVHTIALLPWGGRGIHEMQIILVFSTLKTNEAYGEGLIVHYSVLPLNSQTYLFWYTQFLFRKFKWTFRIKYKLLRPNFYMAFYSTNMPYFFVYLYNLFIKL